jgi:hypothetical protein
MFQSLLSEWAISIEHPWDTFAERPSAAGSNSRLLVLRGECRRYIARAEDESGCDAVSLFLGEQLLDNPEGSLIPSQAAS